VLQCVAVCCSVLRTTECQLHLSVAIFTAATECRGLNTLQHTSTHCNTLFLAACEETLHRLPERVCCSVWKCVAVCQDRDIQLLPVFSVCQKECVAVCGSVLQCIAVGCSVLQCLWYIRIHHCADGSTASESRDRDIELLSAFSGCKSGCGAVCCSVLQCVAVRCSAVQGAMVCYSAVEVCQDRDMKLLPSECVAVCCSMLQYVAVRASLSRLRYLAFTVRVCCSVLQRAARCCSALQCVSVCCSAAESRPRL